VASRSCLPPWGDLDGPFDLAVRGSDVYFADTGNERIVRFSGATATYFGSVGGSPGQFSFPTALDLAKDGSVYVLDSDNHRIQQFTADGDFVRHFGGKGDGPGQMSDGYGLAIAPDGSIFASDRTLNRVTRYSADGAYLDHWGGSGAGALVNPVGIDVGPDGSVYVADEGDSRVKVFTADGTFRAAIGVGLLSAPWGVDVAPDGKVRVTDRNRDTIDTFRPVLKALTAPAISGTKKVGKTLKATPGSWPVPGLKVAYQWLRDGKAIGGATSSSYTLKTKDAGQKISVRVTVSRAEYGSASATSNAVKVAKLKAKVSAKLAKKSIKAKQRGKVTVTVKISGIKKPTGKLLIRDGKKTIKTVTLKAKHQGKVTVKLPKLKKGKHKISAQLKATKQLAKSTSSKKNLRVR